MRALLILLALAAAACPPKPPVPPVTPDPFEKVDAAPAPGDDLGTCAAACERLHQLGCKAGRPTPRGASCVEVCRNVQESGIVSWDLACLSGASSCAAADRCQ